LPSQSIEEERIALSSAWRLQRTGNFVAAFDLAQDALRRWPHSHALEHLSILALASCGSTEAALEAFRASSLRANPNEDYLALEARLLKDQAFNRRANHEALLVQAAEAYERVAERTEGTYSRQNAALLWMLSGDAERATRLAAWVAARVTEFNAPADEEAAYFHWATMAEAALVLGDRAKLERAVAGASPLCRQNSWARSRSLQQMRRLNHLRSELTTLIEAWYLPPVGVVLDASYVPTGSPGDAMTEGSDRPALAYCSGSDPDGGWRELAAQGIPLHVIHPDTPADAVPSPAATLQARRDASGHGELHTWSSLFLDESDDHDRVCIETALGLSVGHADALRAPWVVLAKFNGGWRTYRGADRRSIRAAMASRGHRREHRSRFGFLFADAVSYSSLNAADTRRYWTTLLPKTAAVVLRRHAEDILLRKTWGDSVHAVFRTATAAASAALELQAATAELAEELERGRRLSFRIAVHYGPADHGFDPVEETRSIFGPQLSFAARIVPVAPPGGVFVTEPFAAQLSLEDTRNMHCSYVGTTSLAKSYGRVRLLTLA
jgi:class 3 adenylate cyclase